MPRFYSHAQARDHAQAHGIRGLLAQRERSSRATTKLGVATLLLSALFVGCGERYDPAPLELEIASLKTELEEMQSELDSLRGKQVGEGFGSSAAELKLEIDRLQVEINTNREVLATRSVDLDALKGDLIPKLEARIDLAESALMQGSSSGGGMSASAAKEVQALRAELNELKAQVSGVEKRTNEAMKGAGVKPDKSIESVAEQLNLSEEQLPEFEAALREAKQSLVDVLQVPTESGRVFLDEIFDAFIDGQANGDVGQRIQGIFASMAEEPYAGGGKSYAELVGESQEKVRGEMATILTPDQWETFQQRWAENPTDIELGTDDPVISRIVERMAWRNNAKEADGKLVKLSKLVVDYFHSIGRMPGNPADLINAKLLGTKELDGTFYADYRWSGDVQGTQFVGTLTAKPRSNASSPQVELELKPSGALALYYDGQKMTHQPK